MNNDNMELATESELHERNLTEDEEGYAHYHRREMPEERIAENRSIGDRALREEEEEERSTRSNTTKGGPTTQSAPAQGGPPGGGPRLEKYANTFWSPQMAPMRKIVFKILVPSVTLLIIVIWIFLPIYWGSLWKSNKFTDKLTVRVIDRDGGAIGSAVSEGLLGITTLGTFSTSPSEFPTEADVEHDIVQEGAWGTLVISEGATAALAAARASGDSSYSGASALHFYYAQARNEQATGNYLVPLMQAALGQILGKLNAQLVAQYIGQNANNATAMQLLAQAPATVSNGVYFTMHNLRPFDQPVATAITLVGLIYLLILSFFMSMTNNAVREIIGPFLTTKSYIQYRIFSLVILYLIVSLFFSMINLPFKINFGAHFTYAGGYFLWYFVTFLGMCALGLAIEFVFTVVGVKFISFFLIMWIIVNVSTCALPHELQPWIFRYGVAMPFYNVSRIVRTIIFDTKNTIGENIGILIAWIAVSLITIPLATWLTRRKAVNEYRASKAAGEKTGA